MKFNKNLKQYSSPKDFRDRYGKKEMEAKRAKLYDELGYKTYKENLIHCQKKTGLQ
ncbi:MAG: hypothetical protein AB8U25_00160 [Rickettsiales endosymbiont of Dermacentor nuttalli]